MQEITASRLLENSEYGTFEPVSFGVKDLHEQEERSSTLAETLPCLKVT